VCPDYSGTGNFAKKKAGSGFARNKNRVNMFIPFVNLKSKADIQEFIDKWKKFYPAPQENLYKINIQKKIFSAEDVTDLFIWKNGRKLSKVKRNSIKEKIIAKLDIINALKINFDMNTFKSEFKNVSSIWKIFLLHIIKPDLYPIFDQHVCRAYYYIEEKTLQEIPDNNLFKEKLYFEKYLGFFNRLAAYGFERKELDEALWAFGKYLKDKKGKKEIDSSLFL